MEFHLCTESRITQFFLISNVIPNNGKSQNDVTIPYSLHSIPDKNRFLGQKSQKAGSLARHTEILGRPMSTDPRTEKVIWNTAYMDMPTKFKLFLDCSRLF